MPRSEAQKRADKKYHQKKYRTFSVSAKVDEYEMIVEYCEKTGFPKMPYFLTVQDIALKIILILKVINSIHENIA